MTDLSGDSRRSRSRHRDQGRDLGPDRGTDAPLERQPRQSRAGRNLPAAIGVGVTLGAVVLVSLFVRRELFLGVVVVAVLLGVWEMRKALGQAGLKVPLVPSLLGCVSILLGAYVGGGEALAVTYALVCIGVLLWRVADGVAGAARDIAGGMLVALYPCVLAGFAALMLREDDGVWRVLTFILLTVCSDVGGYAAGVLFGKHPMAPSVSPKKSWEGFAGSVLLCAVVGAIALYTVFDASPLAGAALGAAIAGSSTIGDLVESTIKRDLGIKDMGTLLPGHGGVMDRLDSLLVTAPMAWALLFLFVPPVLATS